MLIFCDYNLNISEELFIMGYKEHRYTFNLTSISFALTVNLFILPFLSFLELFLFNHRLSSFFLVPIIDKYAAHIMEEQFEPFLFSFILWKICVFFVGFVESNAKTIACNSHDGFVAAHAIRRWIQPRTAPISNETAAQLDDDGKSAVDSNEDIQAIKDHVQVPISYWLANTNVSCAELKVDETAVVTHFSRLFVAHISVEGVLMVYNYNFCRRLHIKEVLRISFGFCLKDLRQHWPYVAIFFHKNCQYYKTYYL